MMDHPKDPTTHRHHTADPTSTCLTGVPVRRNDGCRWYKLLPRISRWLPPFVKDMMYN